MFKHISAVSIIAFASLGLSSQANASLILEEYASGTATPTTVGGYAMTDFAVTNGVGGTTSSTASPISGTLNFVDKNDNPVMMTRSLADSTSWWINGETSDYDIFTTSLNLITILLPENTRAFSFNVGADLGSTGNNAWITAVESLGNGISDQYNFNVNRTNTPGFAIYASNNSNTCSSLTSVTIDPLLWGFGNFSINQDDCSTDVPAPAPIALMALGLIGLAAATRRKTRA